MKRGGREKARTTTSLEVWADSPAFSRWSFSEPGLHCMLLPSLGLGSMAMQLIGPTAHHHANTTVQLFGLFATTKPRGHHKHWHKSKSMSTQLQQPEDATHNYRSVGDEAKSRNTQSTHSTIIIYSPTHALYAMHNTLKNKIKKE